MNLGNINQNMNLYILVIILLSYSTSINNIYSEISKLNNRIVSMDNSPHLSNEKTKINKNIKRGNKNFNKIPGKPNVPRNICPQLNLVEIPHNEKPNDFQYKMEKIIEFYELPNKIRTKFYDLFETLDLKTSELDAIYSNLTKRQNVNLSPISDKNVKLIKNLPNDSNQEFYKKQNNFKFPHKLKETIQSRKIKQTTNLVNLNNNKIYISPKMLEKF